MKSFKQYITELFDKPYKWRKTVWGKFDKEELLSREGTPAGDQAATAEYQFKTDDDREGIVYMNFQRDFGTKGNYLKAMAEFEVSGDYEMSGEGDAPRIMSTVIDALKDAIKWGQPDVIYFTADKEDAYDKKTGRAKFYKAMVKRFASKLGYHQDDWDEGDQVKFILVSKEYKKKK